MPNPQVSDVHIDGLLTNVSIGYRNKDYIGRLIFPKCPVDKPSDKYPVWGTEEFRVEANSLRAPGDASKEADFTLSSDSFSCKSRAQKIWLPEEVEKAADAPIKPRTTFTEKLTRKMQLEEEYLLASYILSGAVLTQNVTLAGVNQWSDKTNSDPIANIRTGKATVHKAIAEVPNTVFMGPEVWQALEDHPDITDRMNASNDKVVTESLVATIFGVEKVVVGRALRDTAKEGQTKSLNYVWGKYVILAYVAPNPGLDQPCFGYTFMDKDHETSTWWDEDRKSTAIRIEYSMDQKLCDAKAAYLIINAVA